MNVLILGDSHVGALRRGQILTNPKLVTQHNFTIKTLGSNQIFTKPFFVDNGDHAHFTNEKCQAQFTRFPPKHHDYNWVGFSGPLHSARFWGSRNWAGFSPWHMNNGQHAISSSLLQQLIEDDAKYSLDFLAVIQRTIKVFVIEPPWPFKHHHAVSKYGQEVVHYLHNQRRIRVLDELMKKEIPVVTIDPSWVREDGFMNEEFKHENPDDPHHGNGFFGQLMLKKIDAFIETASKENSEYRKHR